jgi:hypothetical protein
LIRKNVHIRALIVRYPELPDTVVATKTGASASWVNRTRREMQSDIRSVEILNRKLEAYI